MNEKEELAHLHAPSADPKQRMIDYWGRHAERAEAEIERLRGEVKALQEMIGEIDRQHVAERAELLAALIQAGAIASAAISKAEGK